MSQNKSKSGAQSQDTTQQTPLRKQNTFHEPDSPVQSAL